MKKNEFLEKVIEKIDSSAPINGETKLLDIKEWDSLNVINILSLFHEQFDVIVSPDKIHD